MYAADASLEGYAYVSTTTEPHTEWIHDTGLVHTQHAARVMAKKRWHLRRHKWFKYEVGKILTGEICAFRHAATAAAKENVGKKVIIYTDYSNVYHAVSKGRSKTRKLNNLCRNVLFLELVYNVRIHARWCPSASMPADKYTRRSRYPGCKL